ncbi:MAG: hypothetical protein JW959_12945 [Pirellulales bacterium]|nr:hypothetical protein [Pirellulales bacterium]
MRLIYFSPVAADSYAQRPHFMLRAWLEWGVRSALWVNPYPCRLPRWSDLRRAPPPSEQRSFFDGRVRALNVSALPVEPLPGGARLNRRLLWRGAWRAIERFAAEGRTIIGVGRPCALAAAALEELPSAGSFYDAMDNFPEFYDGLSRRAMERSERAVAERVDLIVASSTFLTDKFARRGLPVEKVPNAFEEGLGFRGQGPEGRDQWAEVGGQRSVSENRKSLVPSPWPMTPPILGYVGCIGRWFDWPLAIRLARSMPEARLELIGPCAVGPPEKLPDNVRLLPACGHGEVAGYLARFSAGLVPFVNNSLTAGVDPIKYYDYRAAGLPVLSASFGEMALRGAEEGVYFLDRGEEPAVAARAALGQTPDPLETERFRRENNWRRRFQGSGLLALLCASRRRRAA